MCENLTWVNEDDEIIANFREAFEECRNVSIALYGVGEKSRLIMEKCSDYNIVGFIDDKRAGEYIFGQRVLSFVEAEMMGVQAVVIVSTVFNFKAIYDRIKDLCRKNNIKIYNLAGQIVDESSCDLKDHYIEYGEKQLYKLIDESDVISFDIFDTLIMRKVYRPVDVFTEMEKKLSSTCPGRYLDFAMRRISAELALYPKLQPHFSDIYDSLALDLKLTDEERKSIEILEISTEKRTLIPREKMREIFEYALAVGKEVILTSDMYYSASYLKDFLDDCGYRIPEEKIFVSCDFNISKGIGLYKVIRDMFSGKKILHIGDNLVSDIDMPLRYGIDNSFYVMNSVTMLKSSTITKLDGFQTAFAKRQFIGQFISEQFNNPFILEGTDGKPMIDSDYQLGYYFISPIVAVVTKWLVDQCKESNISLLLFASRDGYLFKQLFHIMQEKEGTENTSEYLYFYASRLTCLLSTISDEEDIEKLAFLGELDTPENILKKRFALDENDIEKRLPEEMDRSYILKHKAKILAKAEKIKISYLKYIEKISEYDWSNAGFFDFVSAGTSLNAVRKLTNSDMKGFFVERRAEQGREMTNISALYDSWTMYGLNCSILDIYCLLENIFTSYEPSLLEFDINGAPVFKNEIRTEEQLHGLKEVHRGITDAFLNLFYKDGHIVFHDKLMACLMLDFINSECLEVKQGFFDNNPLIDDLCNRIIKFRK